MKKLKVSVIGSTGYTGKELIKILLNHYEVELIHLVSSTFAGEKLSEVFPDFLNQLDKKLISLNPELIAQDSDLIFTALPHTVSMDLVPKFLKRGVKVIDLSADYRLKDPSIYREWYKKEHNHISREFLSQAIYGLPEIYGRQIERTSLVANPGCYSTSVILGLAPLFAYHLVEVKDIIIDSKSGITGAGRGISLDLHFPECNENMKAYKVTGHNHIPEIEQELSRIYSGGDNKNKEDKIKVSFTPHLIPINRGILSTCYLNLKDRNMEEKEILEVYREFYQKAPFVRIFEPPSLPEIKFVVGTNYYDIGFKIDKRVGKVVIISVIDNLLKGAAGQAVQNMNIMFGLPETYGLK